MVLKDYIKRTIKEFLNESYKLTFNDKQEIEKNIRDEYDSYIKDINKTNDSIEVAKKTIELLKDLVKKGESTQEIIEKVIKDSNLDILSKMKPQNPILYNQFYKEKYETIKSDYLLYKERNSLTNFVYKSKKEDYLKNNDFKKIYNNLTELEKKTIKKFLNIVEERVNSGTGESVDRKEVRDMFFKTPITFQKMFSEKPSTYLWRGDYNHPCSEDYEHNDENYLSMQSFSTSKKTAKEFGFIFNANNIKSYSGSFSLELFLEYGNLFGVNFGDDEGEVMFFDVVYKCKENNTKNIKTNY